MSCCVVEDCDFRDEKEGKTCDGAVALLGDDDLGGFRGHWEARLAVLGFVRGVAFAWLRCGAIVEQDYEHDRMTFRAWFVIENQAETIPACIRVAASDGFPLALGRVCEG